MKRLFFAILLTLFASEANALTYHVKPPASGGNDANSCTQAQTDTTPKATIAQALACRGTSPGNGAGHTVEIWVGTYAESISNIMPSGTSWNAPFTLQAHSGDTVTIRAGSGQRTLYYDTGGAQYTIINGLIFDGVNQGIGPGIVTFSGVSFVRFQNNETKNTSTLPAKDLGGNHIYISGGASNIEILNNTMHDGTGWGHSVYIEGSNNLIEGNHVYNIGGFGMQAYNAIDGQSNNNVIRRNLIHNIGTLTPTAGGIALSRGSNNIATNNVLYDILGVDNDGGICLSINGSTNSILHNNSCNNFTWIGVDAGTSSGTIKNNILYTTAGTSGAADQILGGSKATISHNLGRLAHANIAVVGNPSFTSSTDLTLQPGSLAIDAGTPSIASCQAPLNCTYTAVYNGSLPDIGAAETITFASASATTTSVLDVTLGAAYAPLSTVASCANVTVRQAGVTKTCSTFANNGNATYRWTCAACLSSGGGTIDIAIAAGKFTDSINIGNTLNQANFALPVTTVANNIAGTTEVFTSRHFRQRTFGRATTDTIGAAWIKGEDLAGTVRVDGGRFSNFWSIDCTIADCPSVGFQFEHNLNGGAWAAITDSCITNPVCFDSTNSAAPHGAVIPTSQLTDALGNYLAGAVAAQASSYPVLNLAMNQSTQIQMNGAIKLGLVAGTDQICIRPKLDSGAAVIHAVTACFDVVNPAGSPA